MIRVLAGVFLALQGAVHLLYLGPSARLFELQPGTIRPEGSWAHSASALRKVRVWELVIKSLTGKQSKDKVAS